MGFVEPGWTQYNDALFFWRAAMKGKIHNKNVQETWALLFRNNTRDRLSDTQISRQMKAEFPGRKSAIFNRVQLVRRRYNKGLLTGGEVPKVQSVRYGK